MSKTSVSPVLEFLKKLAEDPRTKDCSDHDLLQRFIRQRDEAAFAALMRRYGRTVLSVCRCVLPCEADAEDAFQASFLVLARKAGSIRKSRSLGSWLYGVAYRTAHKARASTAGRRRLEGKAPARLASSSIDDLTWREIQTVLHEELNHLPEEHRAPLVLCFLESRSLDQAAEQLGCGKGALRGRLERARRLLQARLVRRGLGPMALMAAWTMPGAVSAVPAMNLISATANAAAAVAAGGAAASVVSAKVAALAQGVIRAMFITKVKIGAFLVAMCCVLWIGAAWLTREAVSAPQAAVGAKQATDSQTPKPAAQEPRDKPGRLLFYRQGHLTLISPDGKDEKQVSKDDRHSLLLTDARWSPDGQRVAYSGSIDRDEIDAAKQRQRIYVRGLDEPEPGTDVNVEVRPGPPPVWSGDSRHLVVVEFVYSKFPTEFTVVNWLVDVKTKEKTALKLPDNHFVLDWSRDGKYFLTMAYEVKHGEPMRMMCWRLMNRDGTEAQALPDGTGGRFSPDGRKLLCLLPDPQRKTRILGLFVLDIKTGKSLRVEGQPLNGEFLSYCWSPDGKRIAYSWRVVHDVEDSPHETESCLVVADADGNNSVTVATAKANRRDIITIGNVDWR